MKKKISIIFGIFLLLNVMLFSVVNAVEFGASGPGIVNEAKNNVSAKTVQEGIDQKLEKLTDGKINILDYFTPPKDLGAYRSGTLKKKATLSDGKEIDLEKLGVSSYPVQFFELPFLFGWNIQSKETKKIEAEANYIKYGIYTTEIPSNPKILDVFAGATVWIAEIIEKASYFLTSGSIFMISLANTDVITDLFYSIGNYINDTVFQWQDPAGVGIALLLLLTIVGGIIKLLNMHKSERAGLFTAKGFFGFLFQLIFVFGFAWVTVSQGPVIMRQIDKKLDEIQVIMLDNGEKGKTSTIVLKETIFDAMQMTPFKMRVYGIGNDVSDEKVGDAILFMSEIKNKGILEKIVEGTIDFLGGTLEFISFGIYNHSNPTDAAAKNKSIQIVTGMLSATSVLLFVLIVMLVKVCIFVIVLLVSAVKIFFQVLKSLSLVFAFLSIIPVFFRHDASSFRWWGNRLQWSVFYMLINFITALIMIVTLKLITYLMNANFFLTVIVLVLLIVVIYMTIKIMGIEAIKNISKNFASSLKKEGTVWNALKNVTMSGVKLTTEDNPLETIKQNMSNVRSRRRQQEEQEFERGRTLLSKQHSYRSTFKNVQQKQTAVEDKVATYDTKQQKERKQRLMKFAGIKYTADRLVSPEEKDVKENIFEPVNKEEKEKTIFQEENNNEHHESGHTLYQSDFVDKKEIPLTVDNVQKQVELQQIESLTPGSQSFKEVTQQTKQTVVPVKKKTRRTKEEKEKLQYRNVRTAVDKIDAMIHQYEGRKTDAQYQNLVAIKRFVNKQTKLSYNELRNVNAIVKEAKKVKKS